jgi:hypothetical protein
MDPRNSDHQGNIKDVYDVRYSSDICSFSLEPADVGTYGINVKAPKTAGTDMLIIEAIQSEVNVDGSCKNVRIDTPFSSKTSFVTVG